MPCAREGQRPLVTSLRVKDRSPKGRDRPCFGGLGSREPGPDHQEGDVNDSYFLHSAHSDLAGLHPVKLAS